MRGCVLEVESLSAWYGAAQILFGLTFSIRRGEAVALMGRNGAGKTTTLRSIMGLIPQRRGRVRFLGEDISSRRPHEIARKGIGFVPEDRRIFSDLTVLENLDIGRQPTRAQRDRDRICNVRRFRECFQPENLLHAPLHLRLAGVPEPGEVLLDAVGG